MPFTNEDKIIIKHYRLEKNYGRKRLLREFPDKGWTVGGLDTLLKKIDKTGGIERKKGSGRPKSARTDENIETVEELILSQEEEPGSHKTPRQIERETGISHTSIRRIIKYDLKLTPYIKESKRKTSLFFVDPGAKVNAEYYRNNLLAKMIPEMEDITGGDFIFQQDGARAHTAKDTIKYIKEKMPDHVPPKMWPPNSPDLNPVDYGIWESVMQKVYKKNINSIETLKVALLETWDEFSQEEINKIIDQFRERCKKVKEVNGKHIEQFLQIAFEILFFHISPASYLSLCSP